MKKKHAYYMMPITIIAIAIIFPYLAEKKFKSMFEIKDFEKERHLIGSVLIIIAHPDDEIMFYTPTLKNLISKNIKIKILCLSNGNYDGLGKLREEEFKNVSNELKLNDNKILNIPELQDNITQKWDPSIVSKQIENFLHDNNDIKTILTFDQNGVTKHPNHISCYNGLMYYIQKNTEELRNKGIKIFTLDSYNFLIQYTIQIPGLLALVKSYSYFSLTFLTSYNLMSLYKTQFNLLRRAHVVLSGYSYFNSFSKIEY